MCAPGGRRGPIARPGSTRRLVFIYGGRSVRALGGSEMDPSRGRVVGAGVARGLDESLDRHGRCVVALGSAQGQASADNGEDLRAEVWDGDPWQDKEARVVDHKGVFSRPLLQTWRRGDV